MPNPASRLATYWRRLSPLPAGRWIFSRILGWFIPYSGTAGTLVLELAPGRCRTRLADRRRVRNHLRSVHAVALINAGELTSGLAMTMALPGAVRGIVVALRAEYFRKARGPLAVSADVSLPEIGSGSVDHVVEAMITDHTGALVCRVETTWRLERMP